MNIMRRSTPTPATIAAALSGAAALALMSAPAAAQLASPSTAALGMGDNYTAAARGYAAAAWNPAGLGLTGNPGFSLTIGTARGIAGLGPITLGDLKDYENTLVPAPVKQQWLDAVRSEGRQSGTGGGDVTLFGAQLGPLAVQLSTTVRAVTDMSPGVVELLLFGNADEEGNPKAIDLAGSDLDMNAYSTGAVSFGKAFTLASDARVAVGATAKYTMGHLLAIGAGSTGATTAQPIGVQFAFPLVHTDFGDDEASIDVNNGSGLGLDIGLGYETGMWTFALTAQNLVNTFEWDASRLQYRDGSLIFNESERETSFDAQPLSAAPPAVQRMVEDMTFKPSLAAGAMMHYADDLRLTADARFGSTDGMTARAPGQVGAGAEYDLLSFMPVRVGVAWVQPRDGDSGFQFGGGLGIRLGQFNIAASALRRSTGLATDSHVMVSVISVGQ